MQETELIKRIKRLITTSEFKRLQTLGKEIHDNQRKFDLLTIYNKLINEMVWSRLFAYLLDSTESHNLSQKAFRQFLKQNISVHNRLSEFYNALPAEKETESICETEWMAEKERRLDILIKLIDKLGKIKAIVGIENKVDSSEQINQIRDYQKSLIKNFPKIPKILIYLTPDGRESQTSDDNEQCPCYPFSYTSISEACGSLLLTAKGQPKLFLRILKNYIDKISDNQIMNSKVDRLIKQLYKNHENRQALKLIGQYLPNIKNVFDSVTEKVKKTKSFPFPIDNFSCEYYPKTGINPHEYKVYIGELTDIVAHKGFFPSYILRCEHQNPEFGDIFTLRIALWSTIIKGKDSSSRQTIQDKIQNIFALPNSVGSNKNWSQWICIWTGNSYKLKDLGEDDVEGLKRRLMFGIKETYTEFKEGLKILAKTRL